MTKRLADQLGLKPGDAARFVPIKGLRIPHEAPVAGIVDSTFGLAVYADYDYLNRLVREEQAVSSLQIGARQTPEQQRDFLRQTKRCPTLASLSVVTQQKQQMMSDFIAKLKGMSAAMVMFAAVIFFGSILNSSLISIAERRREIATFRVLGYQPLEIGSIFLRETLVVNMLGAVLGLPLGYWMLRVMASEFQNDMYSLPCVVTPATWANTVLLAFLFALGAYVIIQRAIARMAWGEALKLKE